MILLTLAVIYKRFLLRNTRLCNIVKTTNVIILINTIIESPYKVLFDSLKRIALTQNVQISNAVHF